VGFRYSGMHAWLRSRLVFLPLGVFFMTLLSGYLGIFFVRGSPHYLVSLGRVGFIYKTGRKPVSRSRVTLVKFRIRMQTCHKYMSLTDVKTYMFVLNFCPETLRRNGEHSGL
jgi:hypothetical protein